MLRFTCPTCRKILSAPDEKAGIQVNCPACYVRMIVPSPEASRATPSSLRTEKVKTQQSASKHDNPGSIRFTCPKCQKTLQALTGQANAVVACPQCQLKMRVPSQAKSPMHRPNLPTPAEESSLPWVLPADNPTPSFQGAFQHQRSRSITMPQPHCLPCLLAAKPTGAAFMAASCLRSSCC